MVGQHLQRMPGAEQAMSDDPAYRMAVTLLRRMLAVVDAAMQDENIDEELRGRVIRAALLGTAPHEGPALNRVRRLAQMPLPGGLGGSRVTFRFDLIDASPDEVEQLTDAIDAIPGGPGWSHLQAQHTFVVLAQDLLMHGFSVTDAVAFLIRAYQAAADNSLRS